MARIPTTTGPRLRPACPAHPNAEILIQLISNIKASRAVAFAMGDGAMSQSAMRGALEAHIAQLASATLGQGAADAVRGALMHAPSLDEIEAARRTLTLLDRRRYRQ